MYAILALILLNFCSAFQDYPTYDEANQILSDLLAQWPSKLSRERIGESVKGEEIFVYRIISSSQTKILLTSMMHPREAITLPVVLSAMTKLLEDETFSGPELFVIPFVNPDGYARSQRKNGRDTCPSNPSNGGVDLNRNFDMYWKKEENECGEEYSGELAFSEPETLAIKYLVEKYIFASALNFHSYGDILTYPNNFDSAIVLPLPHAQWYGEIALVFGFYKSGPAGKILGYTTTGESDDWMYNKMGILSMSPEIGDEAYGFRPDKKYIDKIVADNFSRIQYWIYKSGCELSKLVGNVLTNTGLSDCIGLSATVQCGPSLMKVVDIASIPKLSSVRLSICGNMISICFKANGVKCRCFDRGSESIPFGQMDSSSDLCHQSGSAEEDILDATVIPKSNRSDDAANASQTSTPVPTPTNPTAWNRILIFVIFGIAGFFLFRIVRKSFVKQINYDKMNEEFELGSVA